MTTQMTKVAGGKMSIKEVKRRQRMRSFEGSKRREKRERAMMNKYDDLSS